MLKPYSECKYKLRPFLEPYKDRFLNESCIFINPNALDFILENNRPIDWTYLCKNESDRAIKMIEQRFKETVFKIGKYLPTLITINKWDFDWVLMLRNNKHPRLFNLFMHYKQNNIYTAIYCFKNEKKIWDSLCANPNAVEYIRENWDYLVGKKYINCYKLCKNPNAIGLIREKWDELSSHIAHNMYSLLCLNPNPDIIDLLKEKCAFIFDLVNVPVNLDSYFPNLNNFGDLLVLYGYTHRMSWYNLCGNPNAFYLIKQNWDLLINLNFIDYCNLCRNPNAIPFIEKKWDWFIENNKIRWEYLSQNTNAIHLIEKYWEQYNLSSYLIPIPCITWSLAINPEIFYDEYKEIARNYFKDHVWPEYVARLFHPSKILNHKQLGFIDNW